ncbi:BlaI/MecI/CopY family transcriptional regulator [bacterium]|nr:BlaI/MecI/CopY family transcriptional regulator [bacterium]
MSDKPVPAISSAELEVIKTLWDRGPMAARDVFAALPEGHGWAIKTVKTLLSRLVAKGAVTYEQVGNSYLYQPAVTREQVTRRELKGFVEHVLDGRLMPILHFIEGSADLSDAEIAQLEKILEKQRKGSAE